MTQPVRFAPSPTGRIHIRNTRTALLNVLFAKAPVAIARGGQRPGDPPGDEPTGNLDPHAADHGFSTLTTRIKAIASRR